MSKSFVLNLLRDYTPNTICSAYEITDNLQKIKKILNSFRIAYTDINFRVGPSCILFEIILKDGREISKIKSFQNDISLSLPGNRLTIPLPGKGTLGIEIARRKPEIVGLKRVLESKSFEEQSMALPIALGLDINNKPVIVDLAKMPHLLVAGATGQGKSIFLNTLIISLIYSKRSEDIKFLLIDPKMVEFSLYNCLKDSYLLSMEGGGEGVITDCRESIIALNSLATEMNYRFELLKNTGCRNIEEYNRRTHSKLPYIVVVVDELADLVMSFGKDAEMPIVCLAQKSRAIGIHLIIATQRPSRSVITDIIKSNLPARVSFKVFSRIDSLTVLDTSDAQHLVGRGDMLIRYNDDVMRVQSSLIETEEIENICKYLNSNQTQESKPYILPKTPNNIPPCMNGNVAMDPLFTAAAMYFIGRDCASPSALQKEFSISFFRARMLMQQLIEHKVISHPKDGSPLKVLMTGREFVVNFQKLP